MAKVVVKLPISEGCQHIQLDIKHEGKVYSKVVLRSSLVSALTEEDVVTTILYNLRTFCNLSGLSDMNLLKEAVEAKEFKI